MNRALTLLLACLLSGRAPADEWRPALPGWEYVFPRDHGAHPDFKTEWWYFTGNLSDETGREFGFQVTLFRHGIRAEKTAASRFVVRDIIFGHFGLSDLSARRFAFAERISRGAFGEAGSGPPPRVAWLDSWEIAWDPPTENAPHGTARIRAEDRGRTLALRLVPAKGPVFHGTDGVSQKAQGPGRASHYYSFTRMAAEGELVWDGPPRRVRGNAWFDREWASNQLAPEQVGWDWFSLQFEDGTELMLYQLRLENGGADPESSGTWVDADAKARHLKRSDFHIEPGRKWEVYPVEWKISIPAMGMELAVRAAFDPQEMALGPLAYWEGAIRAEGTREGVSTRAKGYMELTGYRRPLDALRGSR